MIEQISLWAEQIIIAVIISTIFEILIPECKNKKYVKTVIGIYILFTIISPVIKNFSSGSTFFEENKLIDEFNKDTSFYEPVESVSNVKNTYILALKQDMSDKLYKRGYEVSTIKLDVNMKDDDTYGQIKSLSIGISKRPKSENKNSDNKISINKIEISTEKVVSNNLVTNDEKNEIKEYLSNEYGIDISSIKIE